MKFEQTNIIFSSKNFNYFIVVTENYHFLVTLKFSIYFDKI